MKKPHMNPTFNFCKILDNIKLNMAQRLTLRKRAWLMTFTLLIWFLILFATLVKSIQFISMPALLVLIIISISMILIFKFCLNFFSIVTKCSYCMNKLYSTKILIKECNKWERKTLIRIWGYEFGKYYTYEVYPFLTNCPTCGKKICNPPKRNQWGHL